MFCIEGNFHIYVLFLTIQVRKSCERFKLANQHEFKRTLDWTNKIVKFKQENYPKCENKFQTVNLHLRERVPTFTVCLVH